MTAGKDRHFKEKGKVKGIEENPYYRFFGEEDKLQAAACRYLNLKYPKTLWCHIPNEGRRSPFEQFKALAFGVKKGVSDIMIFEANDHYNGLCIELKSKKGKPTPHQQAFLEEIEKRGWMTAICRSIDEVIITTDSYFALSPKIKIKPNLN